MLHVRFAKIEEGPSGWPADCAESESSDLLPGYDAVMTHDELTALKARLEPDYERWIEAQNLPAKQEQAQRAAATNIAVALIQSPVDPFALATRIALEATVTLINDQLESLGGRRVLEADINRKIAEILGA